MKTSIVSLLIVLMLWPISLLKAQQQPEQLNLPGDNLNLYAVMKIFQESETLELFEKKLNDESLRINNLDLNGDNYIDYLKVGDYIEKGVHYIVLQDAISATETQDVAVFVVKKDPDGKVIIQLIGDEALYGKYYIVEPYYDTDKDETPNPGYYGNNNNNSYDNGNTQTVVVHHTTAYEVGAWPVIRFIFLPTYVVYHSDWYWGYYPTYWHPWSPWYWHEYYGYHYYYNDDYCSHYRHWNHYRHNDWHDTYYGHHRTFSQTVYTRRDRGDYERTYSKPESIRDGASHFRNDHPDKVRKDMKDPEVKNIRVAPRNEKSNDRIRINDRNDSRIRENSNNDRTNRQTTTGRQSGDIKPNRNDNNVRTDNQTGGVKPNRNDNQSGGVKSSRQENNTVRQENNHGGRQDKTTTVRKEERNSPVKTETKNSGQSGRDVPKKDNTKSTKSQEKSGRK